MSSSIDPITQEHIYDIPKNNQRVKKPTLYERVSKIFSSLYQKISNLFSRKPNQIKILEGKVKLLFAETSNLRLFIANLQQNNQMLRGHINDLEACTRALKIQINSLEETTSTLNDEFNPHLPISRSDSGFSESPPKKKKQRFFSKSHI